MRHLYCIIILLTYLSLIHRATCATVIGNGQLNFENKFDFPPLKYKILSVTINPGLKVKWLEVLKTKVKVKVLAGEISKGAVEVTIKKGGIVLDKTRYEMDQAFKTPYPVKVGVYTVELKKQVPDYMPLGRTTIWVTVETNGWKTRNIYQDIEVVKN